ncbi:MAG: glycosyltransferase [Bacteroidota bacterium]|nr:glycosyltransferase [Bacteroidota bacterium]
MTKIFITIPWFVPAFRAGGPVQSVANLVKEFHEGVEYFIICQDVDLNGAVLENIVPDHWVQYNDHTKVLYSTPGKISDTIVKETEAQKPDILFIIGLFSWHFNIVPMMFCKVPEKILSTRGMLHPGALTQKKWKKKIYLQLFKLLEYHHKVHFHATDEEEKNYILTYFNQVPEVHVAGNFPNKISPPGIPDKRPGALNLISIALISPMKNIFLVLEALERSACKIIYDIYGPIKDEDYWDLCKQKIKTLPENIRVNYHKEIEPQKIPAALSSAHVFILPSKSENFGHAIYEALSAERPVITSNHTPWNYLRESDAGINVSLENNNELTTAIDFFALMDKDTLSLWQQRASRYAAKAIDIEKIKQEYRKMFQISSSFPRQRIDNARLAK